VTDLERLYLAVAICRAGAGRDVEALCALAHPDIEIWGVPGIGPGGAYRGHEGLRQWYTTAPVHEIAVRPDLKSIEVLPSGSVFGDGTLTVVSKRASETMPVWFVYRFADGLVRTIGIYLTESRARELAKRSR
jgi:hypothetical protein